MKTKKINGLHMEKMLENGLANLCLHEDELNSLNVFPVADGDTGTNMRTTLESGLRASKSTAAMGAYMKSLTDAMLFGARGNSGVILSQLFRGIFLALSRCGNVTPAEFRNALIFGYKTAYSAVIHPAEGTILTVSREGIENIKTQIDRYTTFEDLFSMYIAEMKKSLAHTPELLPELKEAGVVDSGAMGYITVFEGMLKYLYDEIIERAVAEVPMPKANNLSTDTSLFNENSLFESGYCVEFILQLLRSSQYSQRFNMDRYIADLKDLGSSIVAVQEGKRVKVHIHTFKPGKVFALSQDYGEFVTCKVENMQLQHNSVMQEKSQRSKRTDFAIIAVANSTEMQQIFADLGCTKAIFGGDKMNVSVQDFVDAIREVNADIVVILPNNSNLIRVANQAGKLYSGSTVNVLSSKTVPEGYCALAMDVGASRDVDARIRQMQLSISDVVTLCVTTASKDYQSSDVSCCVGMPVAVSDGKVLCSGDTAESIFCEGLKHLSGIEDKETCIIFRGSDIPASAETQLEKQIAALYPDLEVSFIQSGSLLFQWMAAIS